MPRPRSIADADLLSKVMSLFWRNGYANTGIRELEQVSGLKAPSLYHRFGPKDALFRAALDHYLDAVVRYRITRYLQTDDPLRGLRAFFDSTYEGIDRDRSPLGCLLVNTSLERREGEPDVAVQLQRGSRMIRAALRAALRRAQRVGQLRADANTSVLADCLHLGLQGLLVTIKAQPEKALLRRRTDALFAVLPITSKEITP